jgi:hypothetical protein
MKSDAGHRSPVFNFPVLMILTSILCLGCYGALGVNTAVGLATGSAVLAFFTLNRSHNSPGEK